MFDVSDEEFGLLVERSLDKLDSKIAEAKNVAVVIADEPTNEQRVKLQLRGDQTLFGLYEGIPLTQRNGSYSGVLPDKITIFKIPLISATHNMVELQRQVHNTVWHEFAHHFGLNHSQIHGLE